VSVAWPLSVVADAGSFTKSKDDGVYTYYTGQVTVRGRFHQELENEFIDSLCFTADQRSAKKIPREPGDERAPWFCFSNQRKAMTALGVPVRAGKGLCGFDGKATLVISNYRLDRRETETADGALLERVIKSTQAVAHKCPWPPPPPHYLSR
jgi:hypothetical protein